MTAQELIAQFETEVDDMTELATVDELFVLNRVYKQICGDKPYEFTKKTYSGIQSTTLPTVSLPSDFGYLVENHNYTENDQYAHRPVVFVGPAYQPYYVVSFSDRRQYLNKTGFAYIDIRNNTLVFTGQPTSGNTVEFDYCAVPDDLTLTDEPIFPERYQHAIYFGMAVDNEIIQRSDKARNYMQENADKKQGFIDDMNYWNSKLVQF